MFEREDWKLFRNIETLCQKAGVNRDKIPKLIIKELVDNALDVSDCNLGLIDGSNGFYVRDFGEGLSESIMKDLFCINRPMITSKLLRLPTRGALGNGLRVVIGAIISTNGSLIVKTKGKKYEIEFLNDGSANVNCIGNSEVLVGTEFDVFLGTSIYKLTERDLIWGNEAILMSRGDSHTCKTSAFWYTSESFYELLNSYTGTLAQFLILFEGVNKNNIKTSFVHLDKNTNEIEFDESENILSMLRDYHKNVTIKRIGMIGDSYEGLGEYAKKSGEFEVRSAKGQHNAVIPFLVESWIRPQKNYCPEVYVNKTPITGEWTYWEDKGVLKLYRLGLNIDVKFKSSQMIFNIMTPYMPITSDGKSPDFKSMNKIIQQCLNSSKSKAKKKLMSENESSARNEKDIINNHMYEAIDKAGGYGQYKFSQRQLYYAIRPYVMRALDKQPDYNYFCRLLTEYENEYSEIENLYRDPRGSLYHPHLQTEIALGTIAVQNYTRPEWTFNKIIYCEKEGFFPILKDAKFPERFDCALLSSKGYASRAVKDLFDLLGETDEEILFFCIHDADNAGTMIYETLQEATLSRRARKVRVIDLGINPWEAIEMDLEVETFESKSRRPVAQYIKDKDRTNCWDTDYEQWLQTNRVELNAMTTPQFLQWIEEKISEYDNGKVIPDEDTLIDNLNANVEMLVKEEVKERLLREAGYDDIVAKEIRNTTSKVVEQLGQLRNNVEYRLEKNSENHWTKPIKDIAKKIVND